MKRARHAGGFTLIEMLVVISIIMILAGIMVPTALTIRQKMRKAQAETAMKSIEFALQSFYSDWLEYPPHAVEDLEYFAKTYISGACDDVTTPTQVTITGTKEEGDEQRKRLFDSNRILVRFLRTPLKGGPYLKIEQRDLERNGAFQHSGGGYVMDCREGPSATVVPAYLHIDPWGMPYIYHNNLNNWSSEVRLDDPVHNVKGFDLYSTGPDRKTAMDEGIADPQKNGEGPDDINNWAKEAEATE